MNDIQGLMTNLKEIEKATQKNMKAQFNILDTIGRSHYENFNSDIIAFFLDPKEDHLHGEYLVQFLETIGWHDLEVSNNVRVYREYATEENRRIDIVIEDSDWIIGIECKVNHFEGDEQLNDYAKFLSKKANDSKKVHLLFLTKYPIEKTSLTNNEKNRLSYQNIFWKKEILEWLKSLQTREDEDLLRSGIKQYIDTVEIFNNLKEEYYMQKIDILKSMFGETLENPQFDLQTLTDLSEMSSSAQYLYIISEIGKEYKSSDFCLGTDDLKVNQFNYQDFIASEKNEWVGVKIPNCKKDTYFLYHYKEKAFYIYTYIDSKYILAKYEKGTPDNMPKFYWKWLTNTNNISVVQTVVKEELDKIKN